MQIPVFPGRSPLPSQLPPQRILDDVECRSKEGKISYTTKKATDQAPTKHLGEELEEKGAKERVFAEVNPKPQGATGQAPKTRGSSTAKAVWQ